MNKNGSKMKVGQVLVHGPTSGLMSGEDADRAYFGGVIRVEDALGKDQEPVDEAVQEAMSNIMHFLTAAEADGQRAIFDAVEITMTWDIDNMRDLLVSYRAPVAAPEGVLEHERFEDLPVQ